MQDRSKAWLWSAAAISFIMGVILLLNDSSGAGMFFILMGILYIGGSNRASQASNPSFGKWGLIGVSILLVLLVIFVGVFLIL